jgi:hydrogenase maturation protease
MIPDDSLSFRSELVIIGIGNYYRGDDAVGILISRSLKEKAPGSFLIIEESGEGAALMESWKGFAKVILIDAVSSGSSPGTIHRLDAGQEKIPSDFFHYSTHAFSVAEAVEMARALGELPPRVIIYGIEGKSYQAGIGLSSEVSEAISKVAEMILEDVNLLNG